MSHMCGPLNGVELPEIWPPCCLGSAVYGPSRCTCWENVYDVEQAEIVSGLPVARKVACSDCAYRPDSPERNGEPGYACNAEGDLDDVVLGDSPFYCHVGMRRSVQLRHPSGVTVDDHPGNYDPEMAGRLPYKSDGTVADICANWSARRARFLAEEVA